MEFFFWALTFICTILSTEAAVCSPETVMLAANSTDANVGNPTFIDQRTGHAFKKFDTNVGDATEAEMVTMEYTSSYNTDDKGDMWVVDMTGGGIALAKLTMEYADRFSEGYNKKMITTNTYYFNQVYFDQRLAQIRKNASLRADAQEWLSEIKSNLADKLRPVNDEPSLDKREEVICSLRYCSTAANCKSYGGYKCAMCIGHECYEYYIADGC